MNIEKLKSGKYRLRQMHNGQMYSVTIDYKPTKKEAVQLIAAELDRVQVRKQRMTFKTAAEDYIEVKRNVLSPATIAGYKSTLKNISDNFKSLGISDVTAIEIQKEVNRYSKTRSGKTVRNMHGFISAVMGMYAPNTIIHTTLPMCIKKEPFIPTDADVKALLKASADTEYEIPLMLACFGLRRSEICALTLNDVFDDHVYVNKAIVQDDNNNWVLKCTKTANGTRNVPIPPELVQKIRKHGYIYKGHPHCISAHMERTLAELGIPHFSLHKLRHYYASVLHMLGIPDAYIMQLGGWKSDNVLKTVYRHALSDKTVEMAMRMNEHFQTAII